MFKTIRLAVLASAMIGTSVQAGPACFTKSELEAAHLRVLMQQFNVAALNCQTLDPNDPTFAQHYNKFILRFGTQLAKNGEVLKHHFASQRGGLDSWITAIANDAGSQVINQPDFCQVAWDRLADMIVLEPADMELYADKTGVGAGFATECRERNFRSFGRVQKEDPLALSEGATFLVLLLFLLLTAERSARGGSEPRARRPWSEPAGRSCPCRRC